MTNEEKTICKIYLDDMDKHHTCNEYKLLMRLLEQEPSITWVTGADGAKIAFWDVPVWKVIKICEILGEPRKSEVQDADSN